MLDGNVYKQSFIGTIFSSLSRRWYVNGESSRKTILSLQRRSPNSVTKILTHITTRPLQIDHAWYINLGDIKLFLNYVGSEVITQINVFHLSINRVIFHKYQCECKIDSDFFGSVNFLRPRSCLIWSGTDLDGSWLSYAGHIRKYAANNLIFVTILLSSRFKETHLSYVFWQD